MTTVYKPLGLNFLTRTSERMLFSRPEVRKVKRVLFGPVDHAETQKFLEEELEKITVTQSETWNFDFKREQTLNPDGIYNWRPVTPHKTIRPIKKFPIEIDNQEFYAQPAEIIRPIPIKVIQEVEMKSPPKSQITKSKPQRLITDFMPVKKRSASEFMKKDWTSTMERPAKLPRLSELSS